MKLSKFLPIYHITKKGVIISDIKASITVSCKMTLPIIFTQSEEDFKSLIENFRIFIEGLGENVIIHKQDFFYRDTYSLVTDNYNETSKTDEFIERAYKGHFNERFYMSSTCYLHISKIDSKNPKIGVSKEFANTDEEQFIETIFNSASILKKNGVYLKKLDYEELITKGNPISRYYNFDKEPIEQLKDVDFSNNKIFVGGNEIKIYSIESLEQFPTDNISYNKKYNGLPVSNMFDFSFNLSVPHVINQYIYVPNQNTIKQEINKKRADLEGYNYKGSNNDASEELYVLSKKSDQLSCNIVYFHYNIMCFDDISKNIEKQINVAFAETKFKKKVSTLTRKDLFLSGIPSNANRIILEKDKMMSQILDLEACSFLNYEQNYQSNFLGNKGSRLCDRLFGIPFNVDVFDKKVNNIKNQNTIVLSGSGGGKSYTVNLLLLNETNQGAHVFCIDASFSYRIQCAMHKEGVYLTFDEQNKIAFNPFYLKWLKEPKAKEVFSERAINLEDEDVVKYSDWLEERINTIIGVIVVMVKGENEKPTRFEEIIYRNLLFEYFKDRCLNDNTENAKFDDFYDFTYKNLEKILKKDGIEADFNAKKFLAIIKVFKTGNSLGYLLNSTDEKIKTLDEQRFVVIDVSRIRENPILFSIISILAMDLYNQKIAKLPLNLRKILVIDEAWQAISSPKMATFMKTQVKVIRKYGGLTIFISQELDDFISSKIIKDSIINNSAIKIFADMGEFKQKFDPIKKILSISDSTEEKIKSLNMNNRPNALYKEICIAWEQTSQVYAVETPLELKAIFETDPEEVVKILPKIKENGLELAAINYANNERKKQFKN